MKINLDKPRKKKKPGPVPVIGPRRMTMFTGDVIPKIKKLNTILKSLKVPTVTASYVFREGARIWLKQKIAEAKAASEGNHHAKRRPQLV